MKFKYVLIASLILAILIVGAVSATDTISEDNISDTDDTPLEITDTLRNFTIFPVQNRRC